MKIKVRYNFLLIGLSFVFIFNGNINIIDILPDFLGYVLFAAGIGYLSFINEDYKKAEKYCIVLFFISLGKFILTFFVKYFSDMDILLLTVLFNIIELICASVLFGSFFKATELTLELNESFEISHSTRFIKKFTGVLIYMKYMASLLPESVSLVSGDFWDRLHYERDIYINTVSLKKMLGYFSFIIVTLSGVFLLMVVLPYFRNLYQNGRLNDKISLTILNADNINETVFFSDLNFIFILSQAGLILSFDMEFDELYIYPVILTFALFFIAYMKLKKMYAIKYFPVICISGGISAVISEIFAYAEYVTVLERVIGGTYTPVYVYSSHCFFILSTVILCLTLISGYTALSELKIQNREYAVNYLKKYIPQKDMRTDINKTRIMIYCAAFAIVKSAKLIIPPSDMFLIPHFILSVFFIAMSVYKVGKTKELIFSYYK